MKSVLLAMLLICCLSAQSFAGCSQIFVKFSYPSGGDATYSLRDIGGSYEDPTNRVQFFKKNGVWTLIAPDGSTWMRSGEACDLGAAGFGLLQPGSGPVPSRVAVTQSL